jgi:hypothetical protein
MKAENGYSCSLTYILQSHYTIGDIIFSDAQSEALASLIILRSCFCCTETGRPPRNKRLNALPSFVVRNRSNVRQTWA